MAETTSTRPSTSRPGWRDVLDLQKEMRDELQLHRQDSKDEHFHIAATIDLLAARVQTLESGGVKREGVRLGEAKILGMGKQSISVTLSFIAAAVAVLANLKIV